MHDYVVDEHPRVKIILYIAILSTAIMSGISYIKDHWLTDYVWATSVSVFIVFSVLYGFFNYVAWKWSIFTRFLPIPNLNGDWIVKGCGFNTKLDRTFDWEGTITITQTWQKISICMNKKQGDSDSQSLACHIKYQPGIGYRVTYHYLNKRKEIHDELNDHFGCCVLTFDIMRTTARGTYFNDGQIRRTHGNMILTKV